MFRYALALGIVLVHFGRSAALRQTTLVAAGIWTLSLMAAEAAEPGDVRKTVVLENTVARLAVDLGGGSIGQFCFRERELNPLSWAAPIAGDTSVHGFGHFLCLDRWGPPSKAEGANGMPYHGEAANVEWQMVRAASPRDDTIEAELSARLPKAGLTVRRTLRMSATAAVCLVREEVRNENALGRTYNMVQHPTIGPPFLDESTLVDCNGRKGFAQGGSLPNPEEPSSFWPLALNREGLGVNLRRLTNSAVPDVVSYRIDTTYGWVTAVSPAGGLLIGYWWKTKDYPWVSLWRDVQEGRPAARGLEFGTTGLHQPFPILVKKGRIWDRPLFDYLDAGETTVKSYVVFLARVPTDFTGVGSIELERERIILNERADANPRRFTVDVRGGLLAEITEASVP